MKKIYLSSPTMHGEELQFVNEAFQKNWIAPVGFNLDNFEREIDDYINANSPAKFRSLALVSGTAALHLAYKGAGIKQGTPVFVSDSTYCATAFPISYEGGIPIFIDSERKSWNMDPEALEKAFQLHPEVKHVVVVHLFGTPAMMYEGSELVKVEEYPVGYDLFDRGLCLPSDIKMTEEDMQLIIETVKSCF